MTWDLRLGDYREVLREVECDLVLTDPPYSERTHQGHDAGANLANKAETHWTRSNGKPDACRPRRAIAYDFWTDDDVEEFVEFWVPRCRGWMVCLSDSELCGAWRSAFEDNGLCGFQPVPILIPGMTVRMCGDGPFELVRVRERRAAAPRSVQRLGHAAGRIHRPGRAQGAHVHRGWRQAALADARSDPRLQPPRRHCRGPVRRRGTTLLAAAIEGRRAVGAEMKAEHHDKAMRRLAAGFTPSFEFEQPDVVRPKRRTEP